MQLSLGLKSLKHVTCLTLDLAVLFTQSCDTSAPPPLQVGPQLAAPLWEQIVEPACRFMRPHYPFITVSNNE